MSDNNAPRSLNPPTVPNLEDDRCEKFLKNLTSYIQRELKKRPEQEQALGSVLLVAPNGSVYTVQVDNAGTLSTTLVAENVP